MSWSLELVQPGDRALTASLDYFIATQVHWGAFASSARSVLR